MKITANNLLNFAFSFLIFANNIKCMEEGISHINNNSGFWQKLEIINPKTICPDLTEVVIDRKAPHPIRSNKQKEAEFRVNSSEEFTPPLVTDPRLRLLALWHGTWGRETPSFKEVDEKRRKELDEDGNFSYENFNHFKRYGEWLATQKQAKLELISLSWKGFNTDEARLRGGELLAQYFNGVDKYKNAEIHGIGHSHGCNAFLCAANSMEHNPFERLILIAYPIRKDQPEYQGKYFKELVYLHSKGDGCRPFSEHVLSRGDSVVNAAQVSMKKLKEDLQENAKEVSITYTKMVIGAVAFGIGFPAILATVTSDLEDAVKTLALRVPALVIAAGATTLASSSAGCVAGTIEYNALTKHKLAPQNGKIIVRLVVTMNGKSPTHTGIVDRAEDLVKIMSQLETKYPLHYSQSAHFAVDVDKRISKKNPVFITIINDEPFKIKPKQVYKNFDGKHVVDINNLQAHAELERSNKVQKYHEAQKEVYKVQHKIASIKHFPGEILNRACKAELELEAWDKEHNQYREETPILMDVNQIKSSEGNSSNGKVEVTAVELIEDRIEVTEIMDNKPINPSWITKENVSSAAAISNNNEHFLD
ncbi:MAG: hypothetical protein WC707_05345 [Candidatus Babeliaceae bacterium]|jgi:hypothetical protein